LTRKKTGRDIDAEDRIVSEARLLREKREKGYREQALKLYPPICARCGREFAGRNLHLLTVHHKDHNHDNNPTDGSNWELLCLYCHDNEHSRYLDASESDKPIPGEREAPGRYTPFADLKDLLKNKK
jgi:5-methylcytosine-specific restriction endonuclease McrA